MTSDSAVINSITVMVNIVHTLLSLEIVVALIVK